MAVIFEEFADEENGIHGDDTIADQTSDVVGLSIALLFDKHIVPQRGKLGVILLDLMEQFVLALADFLQRAIFTDRFLDWEHTIYLKEEKRESGLRAFGSMDHGNA